MFTLSLPQALALASLATTLTSAAPCNGFDSLCNRSYSNITFMGTHDSAMTGDHTNPFINQELSLADQLGLGIRFLQAQTHMPAGTLEMCHTTCIPEVSDKGPLSDYLSTVKTFLDANPNEVVTLLLTNGDYVGVGNFSNVFKSVGLDTYAYVPPSEPLPKGDWPTLGSLISDNKRLVVFLDYDADINVAPYILDEFAYFFETPYDVTDSNFPNCNIDRPSGASADGRLYLVNHYLDNDIFGIDIPAYDDAGTTNGGDSVNKNVAECFNLYGVNPNVILVDWVNKGDIINIGKALNGLS
ncbi:MAG: hypothetical protein M1820_008201 [Bogoriella megaspora]|nr:MAG: hypothetical protein M1820_008201 [Bogoriella megaspora]